MRTASVTVLAGPERPGAVAASTTITADRAWIIGRSPESDIVIDDGRVSRRHLVIEPDGPAGGGSPTGPAWIIRDVSANGSWAGGVRIGPAGIAIADQSEVRLHLGDSAGPELVIASAPNVATPNITAPNVATLNAAAPWTAAPAARPRRRRRSRWLVIVLVVLAVLLIAGDRVAASAASTAAVQQVVQQTQGLGSKPSVSFGGYPFLNQVVFGKYSDIAVGIDNLTPPGGPRIEHLSAHLNGAHIPLSKAIHNDVKSIPVDHVSGTVTIGFADLNGFLKNQPGQLVLSAGSGGAVKVTGTATNAGDLVNVGGSGQLKVQDGQLTVVPDDIQIAGVGGLGGLLPGLGGIGGLASLFPPIPVPLPDLPFNLRITGVRTSGDGIAVSATADHLVIDAEQ